VKVNKNMPFGKLKNRIVSLFLDTIDPINILQKLRDKFSRNVLPERKVRTFERVKKTAIQKASLENTLTSNQLSKSLT